MARRTRSKKKGSPFGIPRVIILLAGDGVWPYTFTADDSRGGCGKVASPADAAVEDVQRTLFTQLAELTRTFHGVEIDVAWSSLAPDSWAGHVRCVTRTDPPPPGGVVV
ncbi:hypothetical protein ACWGNM_03345 [Streptomyces sp. NPDC055796]